MSARALLALVAVLTVACSNGEAARRAAADSARADSVRADSARRAVEQQRALDEALGNVPRTTHPTSASTERLVTIGAGVTETVQALGLGAQIVAVDVTSSDLPTTHTLPNVGNLHQLSAEGVIAQRPTRVLANQEAGPPTALEQVRAAGVPVTTFAPARSEAQAYALYRAVATAVGRPAAGDSLAGAVQRDVARVRAAIPGRAAPRVLVLYARGPRFLLVFGRESAADEMLTLAGARNAVTGFTGAKPLTAEAVAGAAPDVILVPARGLASIGGIDGVLALPGLAQTPAGRARRVVAIDDNLILGFGPRLAAAVDTLARVVRGRT